MRLTETIRNASGPPCKARLTYYNEKGSAALEEKVLDSLLRTQLPRHSRQSRFRVDGDSARLRGYRKERLYRVMSDAGEFAVVSDRVERGYPEAVWALSELPRPGQAFKL